MSDADIDHQVDMVMQWLGLTEVFFYAKKRRKNGISDNENTHTYTKKNYLIIHFIPRHARKPK